MQEDSLAAAMARLGDLVTSLREVSSLHAEFACKLSLHCYQQVCCMFSIQIKTTLGPYTFHVSKEGYIEVKTFVNVLEGKDESF